MGFFVATLSGLAEPAAAILTALLAPEELPVNIVNRMLAAVAVRFFRILPMSKNFRKLSESTILQFSKFLNDLNTYTHRESWRICRSMSCCPCHGNMRARRRRPPRSSREWL